MKYDIILFDIDNTLLNFDASQLQSLNSLFEEKQLVLTPNIKEAYDEVNKKLWYEYEHGIIPLDDILYKRFGLTMEQFSMTVDSCQWENDYRKHLNNSALLMDEAFEMLQYLSKNHRIFAATNGIGETQISRLKISGIYDFFEELFISGEIGSQKPSVAFFEYAFEHISNFDRSKTLMVGDSLSSDIKGGNGAGIDTCWFNPLGLPVNNKILSTYTVKKLSEVIKIVE